uniref:Uncharacterized protein n=1 Tax=Anguilla anguilla TaxID=7936 RepID=A0A0E9VQF9_ANGAN
MDRCYCKQLYHCYPSQHSTQATAESFSKCSDWI